MGGDALGAFSNRINAKDRGALEILPVASEPDESEGQRCTMQRVGERETLRRQLECG